MRFIATAPALKNQGSQSPVVRRYLADLRRAEIYATDRAAKEAQGDLQTTIRSVGLGRLAGAVGYTSTKRGVKGDSPVGVIYARGGDDSRGGGALEAYSRGATIAAKNGQWLAIATRALPKFVNIAGRRFRITPAFYNLAPTLGPLIFRPIGPGRAVLVARNVTVSPRTGRAKAGGGRTRSRIPQKEVIAFVLIRVTLRAKLFDKDVKIRARAVQVPVYMLEEMERIQSKRVGG